MIRVESTSDVSRALSIETPETRTPSLEGSGQPNEGAGVSFGNILTKAIGETSALDHAAQSKVEALAAGTGDDLHGTMISVKEAEISLKLMGSVRNKLLDAFHEIWRTNV